MKITTNIPFGTGQETILLVRTNPPKLLNTIEKRNITRNVRSYIKRTGISLRRMHNVSREQHLLMYPNELTGVGCYTLSDWNKLNDGSYEVTFPHDKIEILRPSVFQPRQLYYNTLFHEMAHATGHPSRLGRHVDIVKKGLYQEEELIASIVGIWMAIDNNIEIATMLYLDTPINREHTDFLVNSAYDAYTFITENDTRGDHHFDSVNGRYIVIT